MSFPKYPECKDSGVEWLGEVPAHWQLLPLVRLTEAKCDGPFGSGIKSDHYTDEGALVVRLQNIRAEGFFVGESAFIDLGYFKQELVRHEVCAGDVLIAGLGDDNNVVGRACVAPAGLGPALVKADCFRFRIDKRKAKPEFVATQLTAGARFDAGRLSGGSTRSRIPLGTMASRPICLPPIDEQAQIAAFLHRETAKIDALVEEQQRLIELLKEKRQAVISQAVTKGLDPSVRMKDSGVEWLGKVPAHWIVTRFKRCVNYQEGPGIMASDFVDEGVPLLRISCVQGRWVTLDGCNFLLPQKVSRQWKHFQLSLGDLLISGSASMGMVSEVGEEAAGTIAYTGLIRLRGQEGRMNRDFLRSFVVSRAFMTQIELLRTGSTIQHFGPTHLDQVLAICPPVEEQSDIAAFVAGQTTRFDRLIQEAEAGVLLLQERRSALISAAVTGKIDVREAA